MSALACSKENLRQTMPCIAVRQAGCARAGGNKALNTLQQSLTIARIYQLAYPERRA
jgi:hypothetical protein